jgi:hypothetical protein
VQSMSALSTIADQCRPAPVYTVQLLSDEADHQRVSAVFLSFCSLCAARRCSVVVAEQPVPELPGTS